MKIMKILLVDDEDELRTILRDALEKKGFSVTEASRATEGLRSLNAEEFQLVLSDVIMPDMEGIEFLRKLKKLKPDLPVILMSGNAVGQQFFKAAEYFGASFCLQKPFTIEEMMKAIGSVLSFP